MTVEKLAARHEIGLEHDPSYERALASFCDLVVRPGVRIATLCDFLRNDLPADQPDFVRILFIETIARLLGQKWASGDCSAIDVAIGTARLQETIKVLSFDFKNVRAATLSPFVALVTPYGEQHTLMLHLLGVLFDALGWSSQIVEGKDLKGPKLRSAIEQADIVCIGWSNQRLKGEFTDLVASIRTFREGAKLPIVVGGVAALNSIDFLVNLGIDCICDSVYSASRICENFHELETISRKSKASGRRAAVNAVGIDWLTA